MIKKTKLSIERPKILAIDPGDVETAFVIWDGVIIFEKGIVKNEEILELILKYNGCDQLAIEMIASYGMPVGKEVFETCLWIGRFIQKWSEYSNKWQKIYRKDIKLHLCQSTKAKDQNVTQAIIDRFGNVHEHGKYSKGTKKNPGFFYGFSDDMWAAFAVAVYTYDKDYNKIL